MERPIKQNFAPLWRLLRLCLIPVVIAALAVGIVLYAHGQTSPVQFVMNVVGMVLAFSPILLVVVLGGMQPTIKWFITDDGLKRVIRGNVLLIPWKQIYHMANTDSGFYVRWRDPQDPQDPVPPEDLEHRARFYPTKADGDELIALWQRNTSNELQATAKAHFKARDVRSAKQLLHLGWGMFAVGAVLIGWGGLNIARQYPSTSWPSIQGKIIAQDYRTFPPGGSHRHNWTGEVALSYEYAVAGTTNRSDQYSLASGSFNDDKDITDAFSKEHKRGTIVTVYYNPKHPEEAVLQTGPDWRSNQALMVFGVFIATVGFATRALGNIAKRGPKTRAP